MVEVSCEYSKLRQLTQVRPSTAHLHGGDLNIDCFRQSSRHNVVPIAHQSCALFKLAATTSPFPPASSPSSAPTYPPTTSQSLVPPPTTTSRTPLAFPRAQTGFPCIEHQSCRSLSQMEQACQGLVLRRWSPCTCMSRSGLCRDRESWSLGYGRKLR